MDSREERTAPAAAAPRGADEPAAAATGGSTAPAAASPHGAGGAPPASDVISTDPLTEHFREHARRDPHLFVHKAMYLLGMGAAASYYPFLVLYLKHELHLRDDESGAIMAVAHITSMVCAPLLSNFADRGERFRRAMLVGSFVAAALAVLFMSQMTTFWGALIGASFIDASTSAVYPIVDSSLLSLLKESRPGGDTSAYSESRAFGAIGWGCWAWVSGRIYDTVGLRGIWITYPLALLPSMPIAYFVPVEKRGTDDDKLGMAPVATSEEAGAPVCAAAAGAAGDEDEGDEVELRAATSSPAGARVGANEGLDVEAGAVEGASEGGEAGLQPAAVIPSRFGKYKKLFTLDAIVFFVVIYISAILLSICDLYRSPYLSSLGASNELLGFAVTATAMTEAPCFFIAGPLLRRINNTPLVLATILFLYGLRMFWYSILVDPAWTIPAELLHGVTFAFGWAAATQHVSVLLPPELSSTAQGILTAIQFGFASGTGALWGGWLMATFGGKHMFRVMMALAFFGAALQFGAMAFSLARDKRRSALAKAKAAAAAPAAEAAEAFEAGAASKFESRDADGAANDEREQAALVVPVRE